MKTFYSYSLLTILFFYGQNSYAQKLFEDAEGETSIDLPTNTFAQIRTNSGSTSFGIEAGRGFTLDTHDFKTKQGIRMSWFAKGGATIGLSDGIAKILASRKFAPELTLATSAGFSFPKISDKDNVINMYVNHQFKYSEVQLLDNTDPTVPNIKRKKNPDISYSLNANGYHAFGARHFFLYWGLSLGYRYASNGDDLDDVRQDSIIASGLGKTYSKSENLKLGDFDFIHSAPFRIDLAFVPNSKNGKNILGFNGYYKTSISKNVPKATFGAGIFITKPSEYKKVIGGISWQFNDVENIGKSNESVVQRSSVFFYIGYNLDFK